MRASGLQTGAQAEVRVDYPQSRRSRPLAPRQGRLVRRYWLYGLCVLITVGAVIVSLKAFRAQAERLAGIEAERAALEARLARAQDRNAVLRREIDRLQTDAYIESVARSQLGYIRPGEIPFMALDPSVQEP